MSERALVAVVATTVALVAGGGMVAASIAVSDGDGDAAETTVDVVETIAPGSLGILSSGTTTDTAGTTALAALSPVPPTEAVTVAPTAAPTTPRAAPTPAETGTETTLPAPATTPAGPPAKFRISTTALDLGATETSASFSFVNIGGRPVEWRIEGDPAPFVVAGGLGALTPGQGAQVAVVLDRTNLTEGEYGATLVLTGTTPIEISVRARVERAPMIALLDAPSPAEQEVCEPREVTFSVEAGDESGVASVVADLSGPTGVGSVALVQQGPWFLSLVPPPVVGEWTVAVVAVDARGNHATLTTGFAVVPCADGHTQSPLA